MQRCRDRPLAQLLEVVDLDGERTEASQRRLVLERRAPVDGVLGEIGDQVGEVLAQLRIESRGPCPFVAQRRGGHSPPAVQRAEQGVGGDANVVEEHLGEVSRAVHGDQGADLDAR